MRSPPARGWPETAARETPETPAFPARAGMARPTYNPCYPDCRVPRPRGDGPPRIPGPRLGDTRSPPARGWPAGGRAGPRLAGAFPARAGMARDTGRRRNPGRRVPRPRGDGPFIGCATGAWRRRSPPARGWPGGFDMAGEFVGAFPARAGMARPCADRGRAYDGVPRPRGDGPPGYRPSGCIPARSPPARGWPGGKPQIDHRARAFPARAGMARPPAGRRGYERRVPRPRGDGPSLHSLSASDRERSPPARGWPGIDRHVVRAGRAFPARAGMARMTPESSFPWPSVPRPRGDGPSWTLRRVPDRARSPPARGWPENAVFPRPGGRAFPARAGMARFTPRLLRGMKGVPRPRGDGPVHAALAAGDEGRSPPARGWPNRKQGESDMYHAFPARAGMARACRRAERPG